MKYISEWNYSQWVSGSGWNIKDSTIEKWEHESLDDAIWGKSDFAKWIAEQENMSELSHEELERIAEADNGDILYMWNVYKVDTNEVNNENTFLEDYNLEIWKSEIAKSILEELDKEEGIKMNYEIKTFEILQLGEAWYNENEKNPNANVVYGMENSATGELVLSDATVDNIILRGLEQASKEISPSDLYSIDEQNRSASNYELRATIEIDTNRRIMLNAVILEGDEYLSEEDIELTDNEAELVKQALINYNRGMALDDPKSIIGSELKKADYDREDKGNEK